MHTCEFIELWRAHHPLVYALLASPNAIKSMTGGLLRLIALHNMARIHSGPCFEVVNSILRKLAPIEHKGALRKDRRSTNGQDSAQTSRF